MKISITYLLPTAKTFKKREQLLKSLSQILGSKATELEVLYYCLAFLNSPYAQEALVSGRRPTPKGSYQISEDYLKEIPVVLLSRREEVEDILACVQQLVHGVTGGEKAVLETRLSKLVTPLLTA
jgi:hypothetical protein